MEIAILIVVLVVAVAAFSLAGERSKGFVDPNSLSDQELLAAVAGQADWLEKQLLHVAKFGGPEPHAQLAESRRDYIVRLCETLIERHPDPKNLMYNATKRAKQLEADGVPHRTAVVQGVKQQLFEENGYSYIARWHPNSE